MHNAKDTKMIKVLGDVFEAYVGAVVLSDPVHGLSRAMQWLKDLWSMEIKSLIIREEGDAAGRSFQSPMWHLGANSSVVDQTDPSLAPLNPKDELQKALGAKGIKISYRDSAPQEKDPKNKLPIFTVGVYLDGWGEKDKVLGFGRAHGKKEAGAKAAAAALDNKKQMKIYMEKKKVYEAQQDMEATIVANWNAEHDSVGPGQQNP
jgi:ribonuclease-3